jgi:hypothetical protein
VVAGGALDGVVVVEIQARTRRRVGGPLPGDPVCESAGAQDADDPHSTEVAMKRRHSFKVELKGGWPVDIMFYRHLDSDHPLRGWVCNLSFWVQDSRTGFPGCFGVRSVFNFSRSLTRRKIAFTVERELLRMFRHEIRESLRIDGKRAFPDPHRKRLNAKRDRRPA